MATPEIKEVLPEDVLRDQYLSQLFATDEVVKGMVVAPLLGMDSTTKKSVSWFRRELTSKQMYDENLIMEPQPNDRGELLRISGSELTPDHQFMSTLGYKYVVPQADIEESPQPFMEDIRDMCYGIASAIETDVVAKLLDAAIESSAEIVGGAFSDNDKIAECLRSFKGEYRKRSINGMIDTMFYEAENYEELGNYIVATEGINNIKEDETGIDYGGMLNKWQAVGLANGTTFGFNSKLPPASVVYRKIPGAFTPVASKPGTEGYIPVINMKIIDSDGEGLEPVRDFRFGASWTVPMTRPQSIFKRTGI